MRSVAWLKASLLLLVTFAAGVAIGITFERQQLVSASSAATETHDALSYLERELDLDESQQRSIAEILKRRQSEVDAAWHAMQPHMRETLDSTSNEIAAVLRPDQVPRYRKMIEARHTGRHH